MSLLVLEPGPCTLVVDLGRPHHRSLGVSLGGAADRAALIQGNALVGNEPNAAAIEFALAGPTLCAQTDLACVIAGAPFTAWIGDRAIRPGVVFQLRADETLRIGVTPRGLRGYLCVAGGIQTPGMLGSRCSFEPLQRHQAVSCQSGKAPTRSLADPVESHFAQNEKVILRCLPGPQMDWFDPQEFASSTFAVAPASDRMGLRLVGQPLTFRKQELTSEPVCPGAVQVVNDGQCIILGVDGQTIGGYPKIAHVISADLDRVGQLRPEQSVEFQFAFIDDAEEYYRNRERHLSNNIMRLRISNEDQTR